MEQSAETTIRYTRIFLGLNDISRDPDTFQFKGGGDSNGVTSALRDAGDFDHNLCNDCIFWRDLQGRYWLVDGHQRYGLAERCQNNGQNGIVLPGRVYAESDGYTKQHVKIIAARKNIAEGTGSGVDIAELIRNTELDLSTFNGSRKKVKLAKRLAGLCEDVFNAVKGGQVSETYGAIIVEVSKTGNSESKDERQKLILSAFLKTPPVNEMAARMLAAVVVRAGYVVEQSSLFADTEFIIPVFEQKEALFKAARKILKEWDRNLHILSKTATATLEIFGAPPSQQELAAGQKTIKEQRQFIKTTTAILIATWKISGGSPSLEKQANLLKDCQTALSDIKDAGGGGDQTWEKIPTEIRAIVTKCILGGVESALNKNAQTIAIEALKGTKKSILKKITRELAMSWIDDIQHAQRE